MKTCYTCQKSKSFSEYHKHPQKSDGLHPSCKECRKIKTKADYQKRKEKIKASRKEYYYANREKCVAINLAWQNKKVKTDKYYKLRRRLRNRLYYALKKKSWKKNTHFSKYIGCDQETLIKHIESQFIDNMSWDNYGEWHMDHIIPLNSAKNEKELYKLCHYTNIQPMWAVDNIKKGDRIETIPLATNQNS